MYRKLAFLIVTSLVLAGCTLLPSREEAAVDTSSPSPSSSAMVESDSVYESSQPTSTGNDVESLEKDLNTTIIPDEDLSDILGE